MCFSFGNVLFSILTSVFHVYIQQELYTAVTVRHYHTIEVLAVFLNCSLTLVWMCQALCFVTILASRVTLLCPCHVMFVLTAMCFFYFDGHVPCATLGFSSLSLPILMWPCVQLPLVFIGLLPHFEFLVIQSLCCLRGESLLPSTFLIQRFGTIFLLTWNFAT